MHWWSHNLACQLDIRLVSSATQTLCDCVALAKSESGTRWAKKQQWLEAASYYTHIIFKSRLILHSKAAGKCFMQRWFIFCMAHSVFPTWPWFSVPHRWHPWLSFINWCTLQYSVNFFLLLLLFFFFFWALSLLKDKQITGSLCVHERQNKR